MNDRRTLQIFIHNVTHAQALAIEDLLATWAQAGSLGCSRQTGFYADGDGDFRPTCIVNGHNARHQQLVPPERFWTGSKPWSGDYHIDYDAIAWALRKQAEQQAVMMNAGQNTADQEKAPEAS